VSRPARTGRPASGRPAVTGARRLALDVLVRVDAGGAYANVALPAALKKADLDERDRAFATELVYGVTRRRRALDWVLDAFLVAPPPAPARAALRMGAYQIIELGTPAYAAVSATVSAAPRKHRALVNAVLQALGLPTFNWLFNPKITKLVFVIMGLWGIGGSAIIFLAGLQNVPRVLYEAAGIDGANLWHRFRHITVPMMTPLIFFNLVLGIIGTFQVFTGAYIITAGGPANSTLFYVLYLYNNAFRFFKMGYASALAWVLFVIILVFTVIQLRMARLWVFYEAER